MKKANLWLGLTGTGILLTALFGSGTMVALDNEMLVNDALGLSTTKLTTNSRSDYTDNGKLTDSGCKRLIKDSYNFCVQEEEQGAVLLKNDGALPLASSERSITLFGNNSAHLVFRSGAGGAVTNSNYQVFLNAAFQSGGFHVNEDVWNLYANSGISVSTSSAGEIPVTDYTNSIKATFSSYNDAAIVTFSRYGTENTDISQGVLDISQNEMDLLKMIKDSGKFKKTIVLLNGAMPMSLDWLSKSEYGVDACLWFGVPGYYSLSGVVNILTGDANPSGHTPDTFSAHSQNSAAYQNFGDFNYTGNAGVDRATKYVVYKEGIYVGYKYYETRYEDCLLNQGGASSSAGCYDGEDKWTYSREVAYPFGYGLSYSTFAEKLDSVTYNAADDTFTAKVTIKNTSSVAGKAAAELYVQSPFTTFDKTNGIEKSAVQLVGYNKIDVPANGSVDTTITFDRYLMATYDSKVNKQYILEAGNYYFAVGNGAHEALNNIIGLKDPSASLTDCNGDVYTANSDMAKAWTLAADDLSTYKKSHYTDEKVTNQFDDADVNYWCNDNEKITYLTRNNWADTFPTKMASLTINDKMKDGLNMEKYTKPDDAPSYSGGKGTLYSVNLDTPISFSDMAGVSYDDSKWDDFIKQMSLKDLVVSMSDNRGIASVRSISKPQNSITEGPEGLLATFKYSDKRNATGFATGPIMTATWDHAMQKKFGYFFGEEAIYSGVAMVNAPGCNVNRTPYGSRASEYMSEDGVMNYYVASDVVGAAKAKGLIMNIKHCFLNNQETNRQGVSTFANEQSVREVYLRPFEGALTKGGGMGIMTSYNRIGLTYAACDKTLTSQIMRKEWGFKGSVIDDALSGEGSYTSTPDMLAGGTQIFCLDANRGTQIMNYVTTNDDGNIVKYCQQANKNIMYALLQSWMSGLTVTTQEIEQSQNPWWKTVLYVGEGALAGLTIAAAVCYVIFDFVKKSKKKAEVL